MTGFDGLIMSKARNKCQAFGSMGINVRVPNDWQNYCLAEKLLIPQAMIPTSRDSH
jgi:hypothetical protein